MTLRAEDFQNCFYLNLANSQNYTTLHEKERSRSNETELTE